VPTQQPVHGHSHRLAGHVPQRRLHAADGGQHAARRRLPDRTRHHVVVQRLDISRIPPHEQGGEPPGDELSYALARVRLADAGDAPICLQADEVPVLVPGQGRRFDRG